MAVNVNVSLDTSNLQKKLAELAKKAEDMVESASMALGYEILRLSEEEVPHDTGSLQNSGGVEPEKGGAIVGYNKVYAAYLHENPEFNFQGGRKGKYLEDPIKQNMKVFLDFIGNIIKEKL